MSDYKYYLDEGIVDFRNGKYSNALENINMSIQLKDDWDISYFYRGVVNQALGNYDDAMIDYTKSIKLNPKMIDAYYNKAYITLSRKDLEAPNIKQAVKDLEIAIELDPKFIDALYAMAAAHKKLGNYHDSLVYLEKLLQIEPNAVNAKALKKLILQKYII